MFGKKDFSKDIEKKKNLLINQAQKEINKYNLEIEKRRKEIEKLELKLNDLKSKKGVFEINRAVFFDDKGEYIASKHFKRSDTDFSFNGKSYVIDIVNSSRKSYFRWFGLIKITEYYYNINTIYPLKFEKKEILTEINIEGKKHFVRTINPKGLNAMLTTKLATELNKAGQKGLGDWLTPMNIIIAIIAIIVIFAFLMGALK